MKAKWSTLKQILGAERPGQLYLILMERGGTILNANAHALREFDIPPPGKEKLNFFNIISPNEADDFRDLMHIVSHDNIPRIKELSLRNGRYHPVKWEINSVREYSQNGNIFFCIGHELIDSERQKELNLIEKKTGKLICSELNRGIFFHNETGSFIAANRKAAEILQVSLEQLYREKDSKHLWNTNWNFTTEKGEPLTYNNAPFMKALHTGLPQSETLLLHKAGGGEQWIHFHSQPLFEAEEEKPFSVVSSFSELPPGNKESIQLNEPGSIYKKFIDNDPNLTWAIDAEGKLVFASDSFFKNFGIDGNRAVGRNIIDLIPADVSNSLGKKHIEVFETGKTVETEEKMMLADGASFIFYINLFPICDTNGRKLVGGYAVKMGDKSRIEKQLREANERLLNFNRAVNSAIWEWDMHKGETFRNENLLDMIGYPVEKAKGISWWLRRIHPEDRNRVSDKIKEATDHNKMSWEDEYRFKCADGNYKYIHDNGFIIYENGLPVKMIGSLQDVTEVRELKDQLTEEKFQRLKEVSETVFRVLENERRKIGNELHDNVNQILTTVRLFVGMLTPANKEELDIKNKSIEYLVNAIEEIRKLSRELTIPDLKEKSLVKSIENLVKDINATKTIDVKFVHDTETDLISIGKKVALYRIVQEQLKNVIKYSKAGAVIIYLQCKMNQVQLIVQDNGIGFDAKQTQTGVGLSSIYERTNYYEGEASIDTAPGKGCTLTVILPC